MQTVKRSELTSLKMVAGNEKKYRRVIMYGVVNEWTGIGWITLKKATIEDRKTIPEMEEL
jgi:hypothetical protein